MRISPSLHLLTFTLLLNFAAPSTNAQDDEPAAKTTSELIQEVYEAAKSAESFEQYDSIVKLCDEALAQGPNEAGRKYLMTLSAWALNRRGKELSNQAAETTDADAAAKLDARAMADFQEALQRDPGKWQALHNRGVSYALLGDFDKAMADFNQTIELNPKFANAWFNRGEIHYENGDYSQAVRDYSQTIELNPDDAEAHAARAHARFRQGRHQGAIADFTQSLQLKPSAVTTSDRGDVYAHLGQWQRAAQDYRQAVEIDANFGRAYMGAAWIMATCPDAQFRDAELALQSAKKAVELDGEDDWRYLDTLAAAQASAGKFDEAQATIKKAIENSPENQTAALAVRLNLYAEGKPYRDTARSGTP